MDTAAAIALSISLVQTALSVAEAQAKLNAAAAESLAATITTLTGTLKELRAQSDALHNQIQA